MADGPSLFAKFASRYSSQRKKAVESPGQKADSAAGQPDGRTVFCELEQANSDGGNPAAAAAAAAPAADAEAAEREQARQRATRHSVGAAQPGKRKAQQAQAGRGRRHEAPVAIADALGAAAAAGRAAGARRNALTSALSLMKGVRGKQQGRSAQAADAVGAGAVRAVVDPHVADPRTAAAAPLGAAEDWYGSGHAAEGQQADNTHTTGGNDQQAVVDRLLAVRERLQQEQGAAGRAPAQQRASQPAGQGPSCSHSSGSGAAAGASGVPVSLPASRPSEQLWHSGIKAGDYFEAAKRHLHKVACAVNGLREGALTGQHMADLLGRKAEGDVDALLDMAELCQPQPQPDSQLGSHARPGNQEKQRSAAQPPVPVPPLCSSGAQPSLPTGSFLQPSLLQQSSRGAAARAGQASFGSQRRPTAQPSVSCSLPGVLPTLSTELTLVAPGACSWDDFLARPGVSYSSDITGHQQHKQWKGMHSGPAAGMAGRPDAEAACSPGPDGAAWLDDIKGLGCEPAVSSPAAAAADGYLDGEEEDAFAGFSISPAFGMAGHQQAAAGRAPQSLPGMRQPVPGSWLEQAGRQSSEAMAAELPGYGGGSVELADAEDGGALSWLPQATAQAALLPASRRDDFLRQLQSPGAGGGLPGLGAPRQSQQQQLGGRGQLGSPSSLFWAADAGSGPCHDDFFTDTDSLSWLRRG